MRPLLGRDRPDYASVVLLVEVDGMGEVAEVTDRVLSALERVPES